MADGFRTSSFDSHSSSKTDAGVSRWGKHASRTKAEPEASTTMDREKLEQSVQCSICLCVFREPVTLACGHSFCNDCLDQVGRCPMRCAVAVPKREARSVTFALDCVARQLREVFSRQVPAADLVLCGNNNDGDNTCSMGSKAVKATFRGDFVRVFRNPAKGHVQVLRSLMDAHPGVESLIASDENSLVVPVFEHGSLAEHEEALETIDVHDALRIAVSVAGTIWFLHSRDVAHGQLGLDCVSLRCALDRLRDEARRTVTVVTCFEKAHRGAARIAKAQDVASLASILDACGSLRSCWWTSQIAALCKAGRHSANDVEQMLHGRMRLPSLPCPGWNPLSEERELWVGDMLLSLHQVCEAATWPAVFARLKRWATASDIALVPPAGAVEALLCVLGCAVLEPELKQVIIGVHWEFVDGEAMQHLNHLVCVHKDNHPELVEQFKVFVAALYEFKVTHFGAGVVVLCSVLIATEDVLCETFEQSKLARDKRLTAFWVAACLAHSIPSVADHLVNLRVGEVLLDQIHHGHVNTTQGLVVLEQLVQASAADEASAGACRALLASNVNALVTTLDLDQPCNAPGRVEVLRALKVTCRRLAEQGQDEILSAAVEPTMRLLWVTPDSCLGLCKEALDLVAAFPQSIMPFDVLLKQLSSVVASQLQIAGDAVRLLVSRATAESSAVLLLDVTQDALSVFCKMDATVSQEVLRWVPGLSARVLEGHIISSEIATVIVAKVKDPTCKETQALACQALAALVECCSPKSVSTNLLEQRKALEALMLAMMQPALVKVASAPFAMLSALEKSNRATETGQGSGAADRLMQLMQPAETPPQAVKIGPRSVGAAALLQDLATRCDDPDMALLSIGALEKVSAELVFLQDGLAVVCGIADQHADNTVLVSAVCSLIARAFATASDEDMQRAGGQESIHAARKCSNSFLDRVLARRPNFAPALNVHALINKKSL